MNSLPCPFSESELGSNPTFEEIYNTLINLKNWTERYRQLFKLADLLPPLDELCRTDDNLVEGCESPVWLVHHYDSNLQRHYFMADSDSKIIKGLLVLILSACNGQQTIEIAEIDLRTMLEQLDFGKYLTPSRSNGLLSVMQTIQNYCINKD